jgi:hypothetical protein
MPGSRISDVSGQDATNDNAGHLGEAVQIRRFF